NDGDVIGRRWLMIDCESKEHSNGLSATEEERTAAWAVLDRARGILDTAGLVHEVICDSGNGWHLFYPIDFPNDDSSKDLLKSIFARRKGQGHDALRERCSDDAAHLDPDTYAACQLAKVYGTISRKGEASAERPHRYTRIVSGEPWDPTVARTNS